MPALAAAVSSALVFLPRSASAQMPDASAGIPMDRMGSGTSWLPDAVAQPARHFTAGAWTLMLHGAAFAQYDRQGGRRGADQVALLNWTMLAASRTIGGGTFQSHTMLSVDALTVRDGGYPLLVQSGETWHGAPIHDRQHPHDVLGELGLMYDHPLTGGLGVSIYAAASGEPALGPVAFMHRTSALDNPTAPLGHHWQDATHIAFGVLTAGVFTGDWKLEGSAFNGREPDEERWGLDPMRLDSYSGRATWNPTANWSFSGSYGFLANPEPTHPGESLHRATAAVLHAKPLGMQGQWATSLVWGANAHGGEGAWTSSVLLESEAIVNEHNTVFGRVESVQKRAEDIVVDTPPFALAPERTFAVSALTLGYVREIAARGGLTAGLGVSGTLNLVPPDLEAAYGSRTPAGALIFLRFRPLRMAAHMMGMDHTPLGAMP